MSFRVENSIFVWGKFSYTKLRSYLLQITHLIPIPHFPTSQILTRVDFLHLSLKSRLRRQGGQGDKGAKADPVRSNDSRHSRIC